MSTSLASAKKRRANISEPQPQLRQQSQPQQQGGGLTLQQVIKLVDTRLTTLEKIVSSQRNGPEGVEEETDNWIEEFNKRTEIIAIEIDNIKSIVLQLQTFTMEVNKKLFDKVEALTAGQASAAPIQASAAPMQASAATAPLVAKEEPTTEVAPTPDAEPVVAPTPAITLEIATPPVETPTTPSTVEPSNAPILSRFENKSKKNNNNNTATASN